MVSVFKRFILPGARKIVKSEVGKSLGKAATSSIASFGGEIINGKTVKEAGKTSANAGVQELKKSVTKLIQKRHKKAKVGGSKRKKRSTFFDP